MRIRKNMNNVELAGLLHSVSAAYKIKGQQRNKFKIIAYDRAADAIEHLSSEAKDVWDEGKLTDISGVGPSIAKHIDEIFRTGKSKHFVSVMKNIPPGVFELLKVPGIGPKNAFKLAQELHITSDKNAVKKLKKAAKKGKIAKLERFGEDSEKSIIASIKDYENRGDERILISEAENIANDLLKWLLKSRHIKKADALGSLRRKASTVGDIDLAAATPNPEKAIEHFTHYPKKMRILEKGTRSAALIIPGNIQVDLLVESPTAYGALLQHFTGSKHHNIAIREIAIKRGLSISDYGIRKKGKLVKIPTEERLYRAVGMKWIPPELRQDTGEIEAARNDKLPNLVDLNEIKADLHMHSDFDIETSHDVGASTPMEMAEKANSLHYEYIALTEHNPSQRNHNDADILRILKAKRKKIEQLNSSLAKSNGKRIKKVFNSLEIDILPDGSLPVSDAALEQLDFALVSIHSSFKQPRKKMTDRILKALAHPKVKIFAHPTARILNQRESIELNWSKIFDFCKKNNKWLEINSDPHRLDLPDILVHEAVKSGVKLTLGTDAHHKDGLDNMRFGVYVARRGWAERRNIVNTFTLKEFEKMLK